MARADQLAALSSLDDGIERVYLSPQQRAATDLAAGWMRDAGLVVWEDPAANLCGRRERDPVGEPTVLLGSHLDSVPDAGRYDGILGVLAAIEVAERLRDAELPFALEVVAFGDEEGTRFGATLLGSRALAGSWDAAWLDLEDDAGVSLRAAAHDFGLDPERIGDAARTDLVAYLEAHIEQGPRLENADRALGVVTTIAAAERRIVTVTGEARHAATPWELRRDALLGASEAIVAIERIARAAGSPATVGHIAVLPDAVNVIPGVAEFSLDLRDRTAAGRDATWSSIERELDRIAVDRGLDIQVRSTHRAPEVVCAPALRESIAAGIRATGDDDPPELFSIAGHDAMAVAAATEVGMLFVRCKGGISHHRDESVLVQDVALAIDAMEAAVLDLAARLSQAPATAAIEPTDEQLTAALAVRRWVDDVLASAPYPTVEALLSRAAEAADPLTPAEIDEALAHHPRIGERPAGDGAEARFSRREQASADAGDAGLAARIAAGNAAYERRFGRVFLIRAAGRSRAEILAELDRRITLDDAAELRMVGEQLREIALLRLGATFA